ncbi:hypothetical protein DXG01_006120 [Tephrocybe rancida]|nr:hypothetical protein DXG01_006120 [Tephrocybe rancida]
MFANVTDVMSTCDFWQLTAQGGTPPYSVLLAAPGSMSVTNVTMSKGDNQYTYVNRASPKGTLLAAMSDSTGAWASGTPYVRTEGSTDTTCALRESHSGSGIAPSSTTLSPNSISTTSTTTASTTSEPKTGSTNKVPIIVGVCVSVGVLLILAAAVYLFCVRKRRANAKKNYLQPEQFHEMGNRVLLAPSTLPSKAAYSGASAQNLIDSNAPTSASSVPSSHEPPTSAAATSPSVSGVTTKGRDLQDTLPTHRPTTSASQSEDSRWPPGSDPTGPEPGEVLFQHTDARAMRVRELPPPYGTQTSNA